MTALTQARPAVQRLVEHIQIGSSFGRPCYVKGNTQFAALIVPHLRDGADGPYTYLRAFKQATLDDAIRDGLVVVGPELVDVPAFDGPYPGHWAAEATRPGRTVVVAGGVA